MTEVRPIDAVLLVKFVEAIRLSDIEQTFEADLGGVSKETHSQEHEV